MSNKVKASVSSGGIGFTWVLTIIFIVLKVAGVIEWPWIWVVSPVWIAIGFACALIVLAIIAGLIAAALD